MTPGGCLFGVRRRPPFKSSPKDFITTELPEFRKLNVLVEHVGALKPEKHPTPYLNIP